VFLQSMQRDRRHSVSSEPQRHPDMARLKSQPHIKTAGHRRGFDASTARPACIPCPRALMDRPLHHLLADAPGCGSARPTRTSSIRPRARRPANSVPAGCRAAGNRRRCRRRPPPPISWMFPSASIFSNALGIGPRPAGSSMRSRPRPSGSSASIATMSGNVHLPCPSHGDKRSAAHEFLRRYQRGAQAQRLFRLHRSSVAPRHSRRGEKPPSWATRV